MNQSEDPEIATVDHLAMIHMLAFFQIFKIKILVYNIDIINEIFFLPSAK